MSRVRIITVICWIISAVVLIGLAAWFLVGPIFGGGSGVSWFGGGIGSFTGPFEEQGTYRVSTDDVDSLYIDWVAGNVTITPFDGSDIQITEFSQRELRDGEQLRLATSGGQLQIDFATSRGLMQNMPPKNLEVQIPYALMGNFNYATVRSVSGHVDVTDLSAGSLNVRTVSGRVALNGISVRTLTANTTSGRITISDTAADEMNARSVSGRITLADVHAQILDTNTTSGGQELSGAFEDVSTRSVSGRIEIVSTTLPASLSANTTSGTITVTVPDEGPISVQHASVSGRFESDIPVITGGRDDAQFRLSSTSSRISIYALD